MTYRHNIEHALPLPITQQARRLADQFARQQPTSQKAAQVRLNTLAVCVVNDYLQMMGIATDLAAGDSWNPATRLGADVADLQVSGVGKLECRPILASSTYAVPPEVWNDRVGYVIVQLDDAAQEANLLGFAEQAARSEVSIAELRSPEALLDHLDRLLHPTTASVRERWVNLSQWLQNSFEAGWQTVDSVLNPPALSFGFRGAAAVELPEAIRRAKLLDFNIQMLNPVALVVELTPSQQRTEIRLQIHPTGDSYLPANLRLRVLDESGEAFLEAQSREADNYLQLQFSGMPSEAFQVEVAIADASVTEHFVI